LGRGRARLPCGGARGGGGACTARPEAGATRRVDEPLPASRHVPARSRTQTAGRPLQHHNAAAADGEAETAETRGRREGQARPEAYPDRRRREAVDESLESAHGSHREGDEPVDACRMRCARRADAAGRGRTEDRLAGYFAPAIPDRNPVLTMPE